MEDKETASELLKTPQVIPNKALLYEFIALSQSQQEICISHLDQVYKLRLTRNGKLILTK